MDKKTSKIYYLAGNDWYAVKEDDDKIMLADTDCKVGDEELRTPWSDGEDGENGQCILDYVNKLADTYFNDIKYAIEPRTVNAGTIGIVKATMWPMSKEEFEDHKDIGGKIAYNAGNFMWTRTFNDTYSKISNSHCAWYVGTTDGKLGIGGFVNNIISVAPAFYLKKSAIDHVTETGEIILKPAEQKKCL